MKREEVAEVEQAAPKAFCGQKYVALLISCMYNSKFYLKRF